MSAIAHPEDFGRRILVRSDSATPAANLAAKFTNARNDTLDEYMKMIPNPSDVPVTIGTIGTSTQLASEFQAAMQTSDTVLVSTSDTSFTILSCQVPIRDRNTNLTNAGVLDIS